MSKSKVAGKSDYPKQLRAQKQGNRVELELKRETEVRLRFDRILCCLRALRHSKLESSKDAVATMHLSAEILFRSFVICPLTPTPFFDDLF